MENHYFPEFPEFKDFCLKQIMKFEEYGTIITFIRNHSSKCPREVLCDAISRFIVNHSRHTISSIFLTEYQNQVKRTLHAKSQEKNAKKYYKIYCQRIEKWKKSRHSRISDAGCVAEVPGHPRGAVVKQDNVKGLEGKGKRMETVVKEPTTTCNEPVLIQIANQFQIPAFLLARIVVERYLIAERRIEEDSLHPVRGRSGMIQAHDVECSSIPILQPRKSLIKPTDVEKPGECKDVNKMRIEMTSSCSVPNPPSCEPILHVQAPNNNGNSIYASKKKWMGEEKGKSQRNMDDLEVPDVASVPTTSDSILTVKDHQDILSPDLLKQAATSSTKSSIKNPPVSIKNQLSKLMKNPFLISDGILKEQVLQCLGYDVSYGPINDAIRHSIGLEHEQKLIECVKSCGLPYLDENDLRRRGYDKTPDVKLEAPFLYQGRPVCWIESKASFGDVESNKQYLKEQYYSYWNRFGPGIVIYWFGFVDELAEEMKNKEIILLDHFPDKVEMTFMDL